ncbi:MAG: hypothetical protein WCF78_00875 [archaeon]
MKKIYFIGTVIIIAIILIWFFFPKQSGFEVGGPLSLNSNITYKNTYCNCIGFTYEPLMVDAQEVTCYGLVINCKDECHNIVNGENNIIPCE